MLGDLGVVAVLFYLLIIEVSGRGTLALTLTLTLTC